MQDITDVAVQRNQRLVNSRSFLCRGSLLAQRLRPLLKIGDIAPSSDLPQMARTDPVK